MSGYVRETPFEVEFEGEKVAGKLAPLSVADLLRIQTAAESTESELAKVHAEILPGYVKELSGPKAKDGSQVPIDEVCRVAYFFNLATQIGMKLAEAASPPSPPSETSAS